MNAIFSVLINLITSAHRPTSVSAVHKILSLSILSTHANFSLPLKSAPVEIGFTLILHPEKI